MKSFFDPPSVIPGSSLDPIVLEDDDNDSMAGEPSPKKRKLAFRSAPSRAFPKRRGLISINSDINKEVTLPRPFAEILDSEDEDDNTRLQNEVATLRVEVSRLKTTLRGVRSDLSGTQLQEKNLSTENIKLLKKVDGLSSHQKSLEDKLRSVQSENAQAKQTEEALRRELAAQEQVTQGWEAKLTTTVMELRRCQKQALKERSKMKLEADRAKATTQEENDKLTAELRKLTALESELKATLSTDSMAAKETKKQVAKLESQLEEAVRKSAIYRNQAAKLESDMVAREEENKKLIATNTKVDEDIKALQLRLDTTKKVCEKAKLDRTRAEDELKKLTYERAEIWRRTEGLEAEKLALEKENLQLARQEASKLSGIELDLQVAYQQIEATDNHMKRCPFVQDTAIWDECLRVSREVSQLLGISSGSSDEIPTDSRSPSQITPNTSCRSPSP
ncbi:hypothetical protein FHL15_003069 [Xylaria flabelliformis]|uniref:Uncharacterized protein n=1 Tax=Xylaria flabelliformis TaxID=2512241 RepID=A0A553I6U9_9PEZI|nr:hypothetical protein FHL15_003069 [Xylaria flabelliformis]